MTPLLGALQRLEAIVDGALEAHAAGRPIDDGAAVQAKGRALLELSRLPAPRAADGGEAAAAVQRLRTKLGREAMLLRRRVEAAALVADLIADAVLAADGDGTYGPRPPRPTLVRGG